MPRQRANAAILVLLLAAALAPGAAVSRASASYCWPSPPDALEDRARVVETVVIATVVEVATDEVRLHPEVFLKGAVTAGDLVLSGERLMENTCASAEFAPGERKLLFFTGSGFPRAGNVYSMSDGTVSQGEFAVSEAEAIDRIRAVTEQYAIAAQSDSESQGIEWWKTVVPVGAAVLGIFIVGLFLMRIWHRIDPS